MISVIIPTYRNPNYLDICISSALSHQDRENQIIVIVDGYYEESENVLSKYPDIDIIDLKENHGMQYAINIGVWNCTSNEIFVVNDDNVFPPHWDSKLKSVYNKDHIITANQIEPMGPSGFGFEIYDCGKIIEEFDIDKFIKKESEISINELTNDGSIFPFYMDKKWFMAVGGFDVWFNSPNYCDWDFFAKLQLLPHLKFFRTKFLHMYHFGSVSTKKNSEAHSFMERERLAGLQYEYKWKFRPYNGHNNFKFPPSQKDYL